MKRDNTQIYTVNAKDPNDFHLIQKLYKMAKQFNYNDSIKDYMEEKKINSQFITKYLKLSYKIKKKLCIDTEDSNFEKILIDSLIDTKEYDDSIDKIEDKEHYIYRNKSYCEICEKIIYSTHNHLDNAHPKCIDLYNSHIEIKIDKFKQIIFETIYANIQDKQSIIDAINKN